MTRFEPDPQSEETDCTERQPRGPGHGFDSPPKKANSQQEPGGLAARSPANILGVNPKIASLSIEPFRRPALGLWFIGAMVLAALWVSVTAVAQAPLAPPPHTTVVVFADRPLPAGEWPSLIAAVRRSIADAAAETQAIDISAEVIRGDLVLPGLRVDASVSVFLHGDCNLEPQSRRYSSGLTLGWVTRVEGRIDPFIHVDCTRIGQVLGRTNFALSRDQRNAVMSEAIARVILHEWIHIATQSPAHSRHGIEKAQFGIDDLLPNRNQLVAHLHSPR